MVNTEDKTTTLSSGLHQILRNSRVLPAGGYEPRWKPTKDKEWVQNHGTDQVDIANSNYAQLPKDWQEENRLAVEFIVKEFVEKEVVATPENTKMVNHIGSKIHNAWLSRNSWAKNGELDVPFAKLSSEEQEKNLEQYWLTTKIFYEGTGAKKSAPRKIDPYITASPNIIP